MHPARTQVVESRRIPTLLNCLFFPTGLTRISPGRILGVAMLLAVLGAFLGYLVVMLAYGRSVLLFPFDYDQGEGFELYDAVRLARFQNIYLDNAQFPYYSSNYPPVYRVLLVPLVWLFGPHLWIGRIVAFVATLAIGGLIYLVARREWKAVGGDRLLVLAVPLLAALSFFAANFVYQVAPLARAHVPMVLFAFAGIACLEHAFRDATPRPRWAAAGVILLMTAGFTKLQAVDALAAGFAFLLLRRPRWFVQALLGCIAATALLFGWLNIVSHGQFWVNVVAANVNEYDIAVTWKTYGQWMMLQWPLLLCAGAFVVWELCDAWRARSLRSISIWSLYFVTGSAMGMLTGKWGAGPTYLIAAIAASCVCAALLLVRIARARISHGLLIWLTALVFGLQAAANAHMPTSGRVFGTVAQVLGLANLPSSYPPYPYYDRIGYTQLGHLLDKQDTANAWALVEELRKHPAPVWSEEAMFTLNADMDVVSNPTQLLNLAKNGMLDTHDMITRIEKREFGAIVLKAFFYPEDVKAAFGRAYRMVGSIKINGFDYYLLLPKTVTTQVSQFPNAKHAVPSPEGGRNSVFRGKY